MGLLTSVAILGCGHRGSTSSTGSVTTTSAAAIASSAPMASSTSSPSAPSASSSPDPAYAPGRHVATFPVDGVARTAVVVVPADLSHPVPLVFAFHGHGGSGSGFERSISLETHWTEAVVVYPDGLVGHKGVTDPEGTKPGWQSVAGESGDRDLRFYDTMLATLEAKLPVDPDRIYVMGHSNGSQFAALVVNRRGDAVAAAAHLSATPAPDLLASDPVRSMLFAMGTSDPIVPIAYQKRAIPLAEQRLGIDRSTATVSGDVTSERAGSSAVELETVVYDGGHAPPADAPDLVVAFFRRHTRSGG